MKYYRVFCINKKNWGGEGYNIRMLEITLDNCYKCDLEINDPNNSQYFWINRRDLEIENTH